MDECQGPQQVAEVQTPSPINCVTINKVENGFLVNSRDRHYSNNKDFIYQTVDQVVEHVKVTFA